MTDANSMKTKDNLFLALLGKYLPFWPIFIMLFVFCMILCWSYLQFEKPLFEISAAMMIKDERKGVDDSEIIEAINLFDSKKILENEIEIIRSREVISNVVDSLSLYISQFEETGFFDKSAYHSSPIQIRFRHSDSIKIDPKIEQKIFFQFDTEQKTVSIENKTYPLNKWVRIPLGELIFTASNSQIEKTVNPIYFTISNVKNVTNNIIENLEVNTTDKVSTVVNLTIRDAIPQRGETILNEIIKAYNQKALADRNYLAKSTLAFIEDRMTSVENDLNSLEAEVQKFKSSTGAVDLSEQGKLYLQDAGQNDRKIENIRLQMAVLDQVEDYVLSKNKLGGLVPSTLGIEDPILSQLLEKLYDSEIRYERLKKTTAENNPILLSITNEIEKIRPSILENIKNQQVNLNASLGNLNRNSGKFNSALKTLPEQERALLEIKRREEIKKDLFSYLLQKREETALAYAPTLEDTRIVDKAEASPLPVSPNPKMVYAMGILISLCLAMGFIVIKEGLNNKILFRHEIEKLTQIPIIAEITHQYEKESKAAIAYNEHNLNQFRDLRLALGLYGTSKDIKKITVTSSIEGEGKSFLSKNLALSLASSGNKVVLIDFDLHKKQSSPLFKKYKSEGICGFIYGKTQVQELPQETNINNLFIIGSGANNANTKISDLLLGFDLNNLFGYLENKFDYIIIDTPPIGFATDSYVLANHCDLTLFVVKHAYTPKELVGILDSSKNLQMINKVFIVFNGLKNRGYKTLGYGDNYGQVPSKIAYYNH